MARSQPTIFTARALLPALLFALAACGDDAPPTPAYVVHIESADVVLDAVEEIEVVLTPMTPLRFADTMGSFENGNVETFITSTGEFVVRLKRPWIEQHTMPAVPNFAVDVPLQAGNMADDPAIPDPQLTVHFKRAGEYIAQGGPRFAQWPLVSGRTDNVTVACIRPMYHWQCQNMEPQDAGTGPADAGTD